MRYDIHLASREHADYRIRDEGTIVILWPVSNAAVSWCDEHLPQDSTRWGSGYVIDCRYAGPILEGMAAEGLVGGGA